MMGRWMNEEIKQVTDLAQNPGSVSWFAYSWIVILAILGGVVRVVREVELGGKSWRQICFIFFAELLTSLFVGLITFFICRSADFNDIKTAAMVSIASYMGSRALTVAEAAYKAIIKSLAKGG